MTNKNESIKLIQLRQMRFKRNKQKKQTKYFFNVAIKLKAAVFMLVSSPGKHRGEKTLNLSIDNHCLSLKFGSSSVISNSGNFRRLMLRRSEMSLFGLYFHSLCSIVLQKLRHINLSAILKISEQRHLCLRTFIFGPG